MCCSGASALGSLQATPAFPRRKRLGEKRRELLRARALYLSAMPSAMWRSSSRRRDALAPSAGLLFCSGEEEDAQRNCTGLRGLTLTLYPPSRLT